MWLYLYRLDLSVLAVHLEDEFWPLLALTEGEMALVSTSKPRWYRNSVGDKDQYCSDSVQAKRHGNTLGLSLLSHYDFGSSGGIRADMGRLERTGPCALPLKDFPTSDGAGPRFVLKYPNDDSSRCCWIQ